MSDMERQKVATHVSHATLFSLTRLRGKDSSSSSPQNDAAMSKFLTKLKYKPVHW